MQSKDEKTRVVLFMSDKINLETRNISRDKEGCFITREGINHQ